MSRFFAKVDQKFLNEKIAEAFPDGCENYDLLKEKFGSDLKVEFDCENFEFSDKHYNPQLAGLTGFVTLKNGLTLAGYTAGGDWQRPVYFIMYWDGKKLRAYVPKEGNPWNTSTNKAYGEDEDSDAENCEKRFDVPSPDYLDFDGEAIKKDILGRIKEVGSVEEKASTEKPVKVIKKPAPKKESTGKLDMARKLFQENCMFVTHGRWREDMEVVNEKQFMSIVTKLLQS